MVIDKAGDRTSLLSNLLAVIGWEGKHNIQLIENKFEEIHLGKEAAFILPYILPSAERLIASNTARNLGVTVDNNLSYSAHINNKSSMACRAWYWILKIFRSRDAFATIFPYLSYLECCFSLWFPHLKQKYHKNWSTPEITYKKIDNIAGLDYYYYYLLWSRKTQTFRSQQRHHKCYIVCRMW